MITVAEVSKGFGGRTLFREVSVSFAAGEWVAVVGPNGAGKSTLLSLLAGLRQAHAGEVLLEKAEVLAHRVALRQIIQ